MESNCCPSCGAVIPPDYTQMPHLTPHEHQVFTYIAKHPNCSADNIVNHLYGTDIDGGPLTCRNAVFVYIARINKKLFEFGLNLKIKNKSEGYPARYALEEQKKEPTNVST